MSANEERLKALLNTPGRRDEQQLRIECLRLGHEMERRLFNHRLGRRQAVLDHARAFVDFVHHNESKDAEN